MQFPLNQPMPHDLISRIVKYRVGEAQTHAEVKAGKSNW